jgi:hypothetical protein
MENKTLNQKTLAVLAPLLILTGVAGFVIPPRYNLMSNATPYNLFHIVFGVVGLWLVLTNSDLWASAFNFVFGLIDLYQVLASVVGLTPIQYFYWTYFDDVIHVLLGFALNLSVNNCQSRVVVAVEGDEVGAFAGFNGTTIIIHA